MHNKTGEWFSEDADIYEWFGENLHLVKEPSMRTYLRDAELKRAGMDWMEIVPLVPEDQRQRLVAELQADRSFCTEEARARPVAAPPIQSCAATQGQRAQWSPRQRATDHGSCQGGRGTALKRTKIRERESSSLVGSLSAPKKSKSPGRTLIGASLIPRDGNCFIRADNPMAFRDFERAARLDVWLVLAPPDGHFGDA